MAEGENLTLRGCSALLFSIEVCNEELLLQCWLAGARVDFPSHRPNRLGQKVSFSPSCITRWLPEPMSGLPAAQSGVKPA
jgi:hypothetical protein